MILQERLLSGRKMLRTIAYIAPVERSGPIHFRFSAHSNLVCRPSEDNRRLVRRFVCPRTPRTDPKLAHMNQTCDLATGEKALRAAIRL
jgi:hypothetical protein